MAYSEHKLGQGGGSVAHAKIMVLEENNERQELVDMMHNRPFFREIDLHLHNFDFHANNYFAEPKFRPPELLYLLNDLQAKLSKSLL